MTLTLQLTESQERKLRAKASQSGKDLADYLLAAAGIESPEPNKRHRAMEFSTVAPTNRTAAEIDADIEASRAEWESETGSRRRCLEEYRSPGT